MKSKVAYLLAWALPVLALAQNNGAGGLDEGGFTSLSSQIVKIITEAIIPILFALALLFFLYAIVKYLFSAGDDGKRKDSISMMIWGLIAIAVMASVWGLVGVFTGLVDQSSTPPTQLPKI